VIPADQWTGAPDARPGGHRAPALAVSWLLLLVAATASGQTPAAPPPGGFDQQVTIESEQQQFDDNTGRSVYCGNAVYELQGGVKFFADCIEHSKEDHRIIARGNVVFTNPEGRIAAEVVEFDIDTRLGTFHQASGLMSLGAKADRRQFGNQDPDVYFWGETIEKLGPQKYHIVDGGFTTCVQPTPRWELRTGTVTLNLNDYAIARNTVLRVKGVPLMYMPLVYYPIQDDDRATGFLLPTYGTSTLRGQAISNAFFWAIGRSQDATFFHDWFTKTGQGVGTEYRYVAGPESNGTLRYYLLNQKAAQYTTDNTVTTLDATRSFEITGNVAHALTPRWRARARLDYVSDLRTQQLYNQNLARATNSTRTLDGNLSGSIGGLSLNASAQWTEVFTSLTQSQQYGGTPRIVASLAPRQMFGLPVYAGLNSEYGYLPFRRIDNGRVTLDNSLHRLDVSPSARVPFSKLTFLTVNNSATFRTTYYSRRFDESGIAIDDPLTRQYLALRSNVVGPVLTKIWDTPDSSRSQRMKHVIEPNFTVDYYTQIANFQATPVLSDQSDRVVGGMAQLTYGLNNRLFYRSRASEGLRSTTREFVTVGVQQTYYTKLQGSLADTQYTTRDPDGAFFSPVALTARYSPTTAIDANSRVEYDTAGGGLQLLSLGSSVNAGGNTSNLTFSRTQIGDTSKSTFMSASTSMAFRQNRFRTTYSLSWDIERGYVVSQRASASYLAQCCGIEMDVQQFNLPSGYPLAADRRINFSFILAGLGTFSNFFGALGGQR
jgi:LPS-assembly protein